MGHPIYFRTFATLLNFDFGNKHDKENHQNPLGYHCTSCVDVCHSLFFYSKRVDWLYASSRGFGKS